jgi:hypothetical protein
MTVRWIAMAGAFWASACGGNAPSTFLPDGGPVAACRLEAADFDRACTTARDCVGIVSGNVCADDCSAVCQNAVVSTLGKRNYDAKRDEAPALPTPNVDCHCPGFPEPVCSAGICRLPLSTD